MDTIPGMNRLSWTASLAEYERITREDIVVVLSNHSACRDAESTASLGIVVAFLTKIGRPSTE